MTETITPTRLPEATPPPPVEPPPVDPFGDDGDGGPPERPKLKKLRLAAVLLGLGFIALLSTVFGMMMAVAGDIPNLEDEVRFQRAQNSVLLADDEEGTQLATLADANRILLDENEISPYIKNAVIAIEDRRFFEHRGVDYRGIARALWADVTSGSVQQGGSTITQQFVKNALAAQGDRSVFQKLRESATAYHLERKWSKQKILTQYLNSVYFGNGAYGIESAMRTYFGEMNGHLDENGDPVVDPNTGEPPDFDEQPEALVATPAQAALLAAVIASPSAYDPVEHPEAAAARRDLVLQRMLEQEIITQEQYEESVGEDGSINYDQFPKPDEVNPPQPDSREPYFTTWVTQQAVSHFGAERVFGGGMKLRTTIDPAMQAAAESAVGQIAGIGPSASLVTIENATGEVKAMIGGSDFKERPFNLATNGHRQPGSAIKMFTLVRALQSGKYGPTSTFTSARKEIPFRAANGKKDVFVAENYESQYSGVASLATATIRSDNSVFAELGVELGTKNVAQTAEEMGIKTRLSTNPAMTLGGLKEGLTPLEMTFAYSTLANNGKRVCHEYASYECGPVAIDSVEGESKPERKTKEVFPKQVADSAKLMLQGVVTIGTGTQAQVSEVAAGKTGTTENYGDAWFCGFIVDYTTCVWVGYVDKVQPMLTEYNGAEVAGGTWPAIIWRTLMEQVIQIREQREAEKAAEEGGDEDDVPSTVAPGAAAPEAEAPEESAPAEPTEPAPEEEQEPAPPQEEPPPQQEAPDNPPAQPPEAPAPEGGGVEPETID